MSLTFLHRGKWTVWLGLTDEEEEGTWRLQDGVISSYELWADDIPPFNSSRNIAVLNRQTDLWEDAPPYEIHRVVCESKRGEIVKSDILFY